MERAGKMDAREYLGQIHTLEIKIRQKQMQLEEMRQAAIGGKSVSDFKERVQTSISGNITGDTIDRYVDLEREIEKDIIAYQQKKNEIIDTIHQLNNPRQIKVLYAKWVDRDSLEKIATDEHYSFFYVRKLYTKGMKEIQEMIRVNE